MSPGVRRWFASVLQPAINFATTSSLLATASVVNSYKLSFIAYLTLVTTGNFLQKAYYQFICYLSRATFPAVSTVYLRLLQLFAVYLHYAESALKS